MKDRSYSFSMFKPKKINDLIRVGNKQKDGGYVISKRQVEMTKVLIGLGINYDWTFETEFKEINKTTDIYCYDFSVGKTIYIKSFISALIGLISPSSYTREIFNKRSPVSVLAKPVSIIKTFFNFGAFFNPAKRNFFFQQGISDNNEGVFITVDQMFRNVPSFNELPPNSVFVKMDIEESEYDIMEDLLVHHDKINGFTIEFHSLKHLWTDFNKLVAQTKEHYEIIHVHGNNTAGYIGNTGVPNLVELSFMKRSLLTGEEMKAVNDLKYPLSGLDRPNVTNKPDLELSFK